MTWMYSFEEETSTNEERAQYCSELDELFRENERALQELGL